MTCQPAKWECWADGSTAELLNWSAMCYQSWNIKKRYLAAFQVKPNPLPQAKIIYVSMRSSDSQYEPKIFRSHSPVALCEHRQPSMTLFHRFWWYIQFFLPSFLSSSRFSCDCVCVCVCWETQREGIRKQCILQFLLLLRGLSWKKSRLFNILS